MKVTRASQLTYGLLQPTAKDFSKPTCFAIQYTVTQVDSTKAGLRTISENNRIPNTHITHNHCPFIILGALHHQPFHQISPIKQNSR